MRPTGKRRGPTEEVRHGELHAPDQVLRCEGLPRAQEDTEVSKTIGIRCTHGETNSCTRSYAAARKDYCAPEIWTAGCRKARERDCDRRMHMLSQDPRESRSKARTGTAAHNHGAAGNRPCGQSVCIGLDG